MPIACPALAVVRAVAQTAGACRHTRAHRLKTAAISARTGRRAWRRCRADAAASTRKHRPAARRVGQPAQRRCRRRGHLVDVRSLGRRPLVGSTSARWTIRTLAQAPTASPAADLAAAAAPGTRLPVRRRAAALRRLRKRRQPSGPRSTARVGMAAVRERDHIQQQAGFSAFTALPAGTARSSLATLSRRPRDAPSNVHRSPEPDLTNLPSCRDSRSRLRRFQPLRRWLAAAARVVPPAETSPAECRCARVCRRTGDCRLVRSAGIGSRRNRKPASARPFGHYCCDKQQQLAYAALLRSLPTANSNFSVAKNLCSR